MSHSREVGGAELNVERLTGYLVEQLAPAYRLELICRPDPVLDAWAARIAAMGVTVYRLGLTRPRDLGRLMRIFRSASLVHLHLAHPFGKYQWLAALTARVMGRRLLATHHLVLDLRSLSSAERPRGRWFPAVRVCLRLVNRHIAISAYAKRILTGSYAVDPERVSVIYVGTDPRRFAPAGAEERSRLREQLFSGFASLPAQARLVCCVARLSPQKGLKDLIGVAIRLKDDVPSARYVFIGDGELKSELFEDVMRGGLDGTMLFVGNLPPPEVAHWLQSADLFVLPSYYEGGPPTALVEAMAAGCAVVVTRVGGAEELVTGPEFGSLVEAHQPDALATAMRRLLLDSELRATMGRRARERVIDGFDIRRGQVQTVELYRSMLGVV